MPRSPGSPDPRRILRPPPRATAGRTLVVRRLSPGAALALLVVAACATPPVVDRHLDDVRSVALVSLHARRGVLQQDLALSPTFAPEGLGAEVLEMIEGDIEGELEQRFGADVVPLVRATGAAGYSALPTAQPVDDWAAPRDAVAVDVDAPSAPAALGAVARALGVDAVVVLRHEWWLSRVRYARSVAHNGHDRCTVLVVDARDRLVWRDTVVAQVSSSQLVLLPGAGGLGAGATADEARALARRTARIAWSDLVARARAAPRTTSAAPSSPSATPLSEPPAPLSEPPAPLSTQPLSAPPPPSSAPPPPLSAPPR